MLLLVLFNAETAIMATIPLDAMVEIRRATVKSLYTVSFTKIQHDRMVQAIVNRLLEGPLRANFEERISASNIDFTPTQEVLDTIFKSALLETARQL